RFLFQKSLGRTAEILPLANKVYAAKSGSAASEVMMSVACYLADPFTPEQRAAAWALAEKIDPDREIRKRRDPNVAADSFSNYAAAVLFARKAASRPLEEIVVTRVLVGQLDHLGLIFDSLSLLLKIDPATADPWVRGPLILRLWECNRFAEVNKRLADLPPQTKTPEAIELSAIHAICLVQAGKAAEAAAIADQLAQMKGNKIAAAWEVILRLQYLGATGDLSKLVHTVKEAIDSSRERAWPYLWASLGEAYSALGERDLAVHAFTRSRESAPFWFVPRLRLSRLLLETGQLEAAAAEAEAARMVLPHPLTQGNYLVVAASRTPVGQPVDPAIVRQVTELQKQYPGDEATLPLYVHILVQAQQKDEARKVLREALAKEQPLSAASLIGLAAASRRSDLGVENDCIDLAIKKYGLTPELAVTQAAMLGSAEKPANMIALYQKAREKGAGPENEIAWRLGWARLLETLRDAGAVKAWAELGDDPSLKGNIVVQKAVLGSPVARSDRALVDRTIERLKAITGDDAAVWREARARSLLQDKTPASAAQARQLLDETIRIAPASADAHLLLGALLESQGELDGALKSFSEAARLRPSPSLTLQMARLQMQRSDFAGVRELLGGLHAAQLDPTQQIQMAMLYTQLGDVKGATAIVKELGDIPTDPAAGIFLVQLDRANGNLERAETRLGELLKNPSLPVIAAAADFYAASGQMDRARATLEGLQSLKLQPGERELAEAEFLDRHGVKAAIDEATKAAIDEAVKAANAATDKDAINKAVDKAVKAAVDKVTKAATDKFAAAAKAMPADARTQVTYISHLLRLGRLDDAIAAARQASVELPSYLPLASFLKQQQALQSLGGGAEFLGLADAILHGHSDSKAAAEAIDILVASRKEPLSQLVSRLRPLADRSPLLSPLQLLVIKAYRAMGQLGEAANIASRTARAIPNSVDAARRAAQTQIDAGEWNQALAAAQAWRQLAPADRLDADLLCAEAYLRLGNYSAALNEIARHVPAARKDPKNLAAVIQIQARILVLGGDYDNARELLLPLLKDRNWRIYYYQLAAMLVRNPDVAAKWLKDLAQVIPADQIDEQVNVAGGWIDRGIKSKRDDFRAVGRDMLKKLLEANPDNVVVVYGSAMLHAEDGDRKAGEAGYRRALALDPKHTLAMNNLAMLLAEDGRNLDEAASLITKALEIQPNFPPFTDTLAFVEGKRKNQSAAMAAIQRSINLDPVNTIWRLRKIELCLDFGDKQGASRAIGEIDQLDKKIFSEEAMEKLLDYRNRVSGRSVTMPGTMPGTR
ncbi:MAG: hypothetical protein ABSH20_09785, partial [Tepidisphaeraceae bacterium]